MRRTPEEDWAHGIERLANGMDRLPCGCLMGTSGDKFVLEPCSLDCEVYLYAMRESARAGKPIITLDARDAGL